MGELRVRPQRKKGTLRIQSWAKSVVALALTPNDLVVGISDEFNFAHVARASLHVLQRGGEHELTGRRLVRAGLLLGSELRR